MSKARGRPTSVARRQAGRRGLWCLAAGALLFVSQASAWGVAAPTVRLTGVATRTGGGATTVVIETSEPVAYVTAQPDPLTLLIDLRNVTPGDVKPAGFGGAVAEVAIESVTADDETRVARIRLLLSQPASPQVRSKWNTVIVDFGGTASDDVRTAAAPAAVRNEDGAVRAVHSRPAAPPPAPAGAPAATLTKIEVTTGPEGTRVRFLGTGELRAGTVEPAKDLPPRLVIDFPGALFSVPAVTAVGKGPVERVRVAVNSRQPLVTRAVIDLKAQVAHRVESRDGALIITLDEDATRRPAAPAVAPAVAPDVEPAATPQAPPAPALAKPTAAPPAVTDPAPTPAAAAGRKPTPVVVATPAPAASKIEAKPVEPKPAEPKPPVVAPAEPKPAAQKPEAAQAKPQAAPGEKQYTGHLVTFDFQQADLRSVLRTFSEISGLNVVIDPAVPTATVDVSLREVPWDQALDVILRSNRLGYVVESNVVRISRLEDLAKEEQDRQKLVEAQAMGGQLKVYTRSLSYAKAVDLAKLLKDTRVITSRGSAIVDERTNTIIINDLQEALDRAEGLIKDLDAPQPQVEIEARIVQTSHQAARALGVQWGVSGKMTSELGNTSPLQFPAVAGVRGTVGGTQGDPNGPVRQLVPTGVNLPADSATSGIGILMGTLNGSFNLDVALSAMEKKGQGKLLSQPKVMMQNNVQAEMYQGVQIPIQTVSNNTVTVTFKDAALSLKVRPQITSADTVIMEIILENGTPDYANKVQGIPPINTQRATTQVLVNNTETMVIGGIMERNETSQKEGVPGLSRIPLLGWLFKRDSNSDDSRELLIFITPRIRR